MKGDPVACGEGKLDVKKLVERRALGTCSVHFSVFPISARLVDLSLSLSPPGLGVVPCGCTS